MLQDTWTLVSLRKVISPTRNQTYIPCIGKWFLFFFKLINYWGSTESSLLHGLSLVAVRTTSSCGVWVSHYGHFSCCTGSRVVGFSSCGAQSLLLCSLWGLPGIGIGPVAPELADSLPLSHLGRPRCTFDSCIIYGMCNGSFSFFGTDY